MLLLKTYRSILRFIKPNSGLTKLSFNRIVNPLFAKVQSPLQATMADGTPIEVDISDYHGRILWLFGSNDWKVSRTVNALLGPGDTMLDIGANYSTIGMAARHHIGGSGHVHLFEPQPHLANRVAAACDAVGAENVTLHKVALFDKEGEMEMSLSDGHSGLATLVGLSNEKRLSDTIKVPVYRTDTYVRTLVKDKSFGVKIDIEGAEPNVLSGLLGFEKLKFVVFEGDRNKRTLFDMFTNHGFAIFGLCRTVFRPQVELLNGFEDWSKFHDFVAVPAPHSKVTEKISLAQFANLLNVSKDQSS